MKAEWHKIQDKIPERLESVIGCSLDKAGNLLIGECWYIGNNQFYFFDQEWNEPNLPVEYILYRAILYTISSASLSIINPCFFFT